MSYTEQPPLPVRVSMRSQAIVTALGIWELIGTRVDADACNDVELLERIAEGLRERP
ncbi:hypothetical protein [Nocardia brevicatena]|uniref:hypothetical protein n=1 Tax=Nocardia brevicatena TaxID=37327 RepID=UPI0002F51CC4|nr:hypothetical protein [Nocardia brevicatena]